MTGYRVHHPPDIAAGPEGLRVTMRIRVGPEALAPLYICIGVVACITGGGFLLGAVSLIRGDQDAAISLFPVLGGGAFLVVGLRQLRWYGRGKEVAVVGGGLLTLRYDLDGEGEPTRFALERIRSLRADPQEHHFRDFMHSFACGDIVFDYHDYSVRFGVGLGAEEAEFLAEMLREHLPGGAHPPQPGQGPPPDGAAGIPPGAGEKWGRRTWPQRSGAAERSRAEYRRPPEVRPGEDH